MANFESHPGRVNINGTVLAVDGTSVIVGLAGPKDFDGNDLSITNAGDDLMIMDAGESGGSRLYKITVKPSVQATKVEVTDEIFAITSKWQTWSKFTIKFRFGTTSASFLVVRPITAELFPGSRDVFRSASTFPGKAINIDTFKAGDQSNAPLFVDLPAKPVHFGVFAAKLGRVERAFILMKPANSRPDKLMIVISHGFGQNHAYYSGLGYSNPLSLPLVKDVTDRFMLARWGQQLFAATGEYALLMPVRAQGGGQGELGPFISQPGVGANIVAKIMGLSGDAFGIKSVDVVTFSSGIHECNTFLSTGGRGLAFARGFNQDPAGAAALSSAVGTRKQYLSGQTGGARAGFESLPLARWANEPNFATKNGMDLFNYLHTWCIPHHTLFLGLKT